MPFGVDEKARADDTVAALGGVDADDGGTVIFIDGAHPLLDGVQHFARVLVRGKKPGGAEDGGAGGEGELPAARN